MCGWVTYPRHPLPSVESRECNPSPFSNPCYWKPTSSMSNAGMPTLGGSERSVDVGVGCEISVLRWNLIRKVYPSPVQLWYHHRNLCSLWIPPIALKSGISCRELVTGALSVAAIGWGQLLLSLKVYKLNQTVLTWEFPVLNVYLLV